MDPIRPQHDPVVEGFLKEIVPLRRGIEKIVLFGSRARGDSKPYSDYDVLVVVPKREQTLVDALHDAAMETLYATGRLISLKIYKREDFDRGCALPTPFMRNVLKDGSPLDKKTKELVDGYMAKAREKFTAANEWLSQKKFYDDVASRAYYAAFHAAQALLASDGLEADTHQGVVSLFGLHFAKLEKVPAKMGRYLNNLKDDRESGDYDLYSGIDEEVAVNAVREAREFLAEAEKYLKNLNT